MAVILLRRVHWNEEARLEAKASGIDVDDDPRISAFEFYVATAPRLRDASPIPKSEDDHGPVFSYKTKALRGRSLLIYFQTYKDGDLERAEVMGLLGVKK